MGRVLRVAGLAAAVLAAAAACTTDIGNLGATPAVASGVNDAGVIVGSSGVVGSSGTHAFRRSATGTMTDLGTLPGGSFSAAVRVNGAGTVVGTSEGPVPGTAPVELATRAVEWDAAGTITDLGTLGGSWAEVRDLDEQGRVVGFSETDTGEIQAFVFDPAVGTMTGLPALPGGGSTFALGMDDVGDVVGYQWGASFDATPVRWDLAAGTVTDLTPSWGPGLLTDVAADGTLIGQADVTTGTVTDTEAAILRPTDAAPVELGTGEQSYPTSINDDGVVVGYRTDTASPLAFRWDSTGGAASLAQDESYAWDISASGQMVGSLGDTAVIFSVG